MSCSIKGCDKPVRMSVGEVDLCETHDHMVFDWWREQMRCIIRCDLCGTPLTDDEGASMPYCPACLDRENAKERK